MHGIEILNKHGVIAGFKSTIDNSNNSNLKNITRELNMYNKPTIISRVRGTLGSFAWSVVHEKRN